MKRQISIMLVLAVLISSLSLGGIGASANTSQVYLDAEVNAYVNFNASDLTRLKEIEAEYRSVEGHESLATYKRVVTAIAKLEAGADFYDDFAGYTDEEGKKVTDYYVQGAGNEVTAGVNTGALTATTTQSKSKGAAALLKIADSVTQGRTINKITAKIYYVGTIWDSKAYAVIGTYINEEKTTLLYTDIHLITVNLFGYNNNYSKKTNLIANEEKINVDTSEVSSAEFDKNQWLDMEFWYDADASTYKIKLVGKSADETIQITADFKTGKKPTDEFYFGVGYTKGTVNVFDEISVEFDNTALINAIDEKVAGYVNFKKTDLEALKLIKAEYEEFSQKELSTHKNYTRLLNAITKLEAGADFYDDFAGYTGDEGKSVTDVYDILYRNEAKTAATISVKNDTDNTNYLSVSIPKNSSYAGNAQLFGLKQSFLNGRTVKKMSGKVYINRSDWDVNNTVFAPEAVSGKTSYKLSVDNKYVIGADDRQKGAWNTSGKQVDNATGWYDFTYEWNTDTRKYDMSVIMSEVNTIKGSLAVTDKKPNGGVSFGIHNSNGNYKLLKDLSVEFTPTVEEQINDTVTGALQLTDGASIRVTSPTGIRFETNITGGTDALVASIKALDSTITDVSFGTLISPWGSAASFVSGGYEFTHEGLENYKTAHSNVTTAYVDSVTAKYNDEAKSNYTAALVNLNTSSYTRKFTARAYVKITRGENFEYIYSSGTTTRTISDVAKAVRDAGYLLSDGSVMSDDQKSTINGFIVE